MATGLFAQEPISIDLKTKESRQRTVKALRDKHEKDKMAAEARAHVMGWPIRGERNGRGFELMAIDDRGQPLYYQTCNANAAISTAANLVRNTPPYNVSGSNLTVGVWDEGSALVTHQEFVGRVTNMNGAASSSHSTHVAGTIGAAGVVASTKGMAPGVHIDSYDWGNDTSEMAGRAATASGEAGMIYISNHSYGHEMTTNNLHLFGQYSSYASARDSIHYDAPYYLAFMSAGNDRGLGGKVYDSVGDMASGKNGMTVGAVNDAVSGGVRSLAAAGMTSFSGWGPADDGRVKPDIVANGDSLNSANNSGDSSYTSKSGTSMSTPNAAGSATLLVDYYGKQFGGQAMRSSTLKGLIIHTADDLGNAGPDYAYGWGLMNTKAAADLIAAYVAAPSGLSIHEGLLVQKTTNTFRFQRDGAGPVWITICWTDPEGAATGATDDRTPKLVNDLDIRVVSPDGTTTNFPYVLDVNNPANVATTGDNIVDNVEQIRIAAPVAGIYTLIVSHKKTTLSGGQQDYSMLLSGHSTDTLVVTPLTQPTVTGPVGGPFSPSSSTFTLTNSGGTPLAWTASGAQAGMDVMPASGVLSGGASTNVSAGANAAAALLSIASYSNTVTFSNLTTGARLERLVSLNVTQAVVGAGASLVTEGYSPTNGALDPNELVTVDFVLRNTGPLNAANVVATLLPAGVVTSPGGAQNYGTLVGGGAAVSRPFTFTASGICGDTVPAVMQLQSGALDLGNVTNMFTLGAPAAAVTNHFATGDIAVAIPSTSTNDIPIVVANAGPLFKVSARVRINHTYDSDLILRLIHPDGASVTLANKRGGSGDNYGSGATNSTGVFTVFDDDAATAISAGTAPFAGTYRPESPLSALKWKPVEGTWTLRVIDTAAGDTGTVYGVQLDIIPSTRVCSTGPAPVLQVTPASYDFGSIQIGETNATAFSVVNAGSAVLTGTVSVAGPFSILGGTPFSIEPEQSCMVDVAFAPADTVSYTNVLVFSSNGGNSSNTLVGTGTVIPEAPVVGNDVQTNSLPGGCVLGGTLVSGIVANAWICWGTSDPGPASLEAWDHVVPVGSVAEGVPFSVTVSGLVNSVSYLYRCFVSNSVGTDWSDAALSFSGLEVPPPVAGFTATPTGGFVPLTVTFTDVSSGTITNRFWSFGDGATTNTSATEVSHTYAMVGTNSVALTVSGPGGADTQTRDSYISVIHDMKILQIVSAHGPANPPAGMYTNISGSVLNCHAASPSLQGGTQYVCTGWTMSGNEPASGVTNALAMTHTNNALLTWQWSPQHALPVVDCETGATAVGVYAATMRGELRGGINADVRIYMGTNDAGATTTGWSTSLVVGVVGEGGVFPAPITGLVSDTTYYYRCLASNAVGSAWTPTAATFRTLIDNSVRKIPYRDSFEGYTVLDSLVGTNGWLSDNPSVALITNGRPDVAENGWLAYTTTNLFPLTGASHTKVVKVGTESGAITNRYAASVAPRIWVDMLIQPFRMQPEFSGGAVSPGGRAAFYFNSAGNLVNYCGDIATQSNRWSTNSVRQFASNQWVRLTVQWDYAEAHGIDYYSVALDGVTVTSACAYANTSDAIPPQGGVWFAQANLPGGPRPNLGSVIIAGLAYLDDYVVSTNQVPFGTSFWTVTVGSWPLWAGGSVVAPSGTFTMVDGGFLVITNTPAPFWTNAYCVLNGVTSAPAGTKDLSPVLGDINYIACFAPLRAISNVPHWWLASNHLTNGVTFDEAATNDTDGDGYANWYEHLTSTDPGDSNSIFRISSLYQLNGTNHAKWVSACIDPGLPPFGVQGTTNLVTQGFTNVNQDGNPVFVTRSLTNIFAWPASQGAGAGFFRVVVP